MVFVSGGRGDGVRLVAGFLEGTTESFVAGMSFVEGLFDDMVIF